MGGERGERERELGISSGQSGNIFRSYSDLIELNPQFTGAIV